MILVADYIADFLAKHQVRDVFAISGASNLRLLDAIARHPELNYLCPHHEQAGVMACTAYTRISGRPSVFLATAGPGATNTLTGVASAFLDSIPVIVIAGQEKSEFMDAEKRTRCKGVQGLDMVNIASPLTKYAVCVSKVKDVRYALERAFYEAYSGRPGPVWIEFTQDVQTLEIDPDKAPGFTPPAASTQEDYYRQLARETLTLVSSAKRPLIWAGHAIRLAHCEDDFHEVLTRLSIPSLATWQAADLLEETHPLYVGRAGIYGQRGANFCLQNCDLLITLGTRLAIPQIGYVQAEWARAAKKVIVEIDPTEIAKLTKKPEVLVQGDVASFLKALKQELGNYKYNPDGNEWLAQCKRWQTQYPPFLPEYKREPKGFVNSYYFIDRLSEILNSDDIIVTDMGTSLTCTHATLRIKKGQRLVTSTGLGEMGYGLPGAIGACFGSGKNRTIFIGAEGSLMMNLQELQTVIHHKLPIKIFIFNNNGYLTIKHTERALFGERFSGCTPESGVSFPSLEKIAKAYGFDYFRIDDSVEVENSIKHILSTPGASFCEVLMPQDQFLGPKSAIKIRADGSIYSPPLEDLAPFLPRHELQQNMLIPLLPE